MRALRLAGFLSDARRGPDPGPVPRGLGNKDKMRRQIAAKTTQNRAGLARYLRARGHTPRINRWRGTAT